MKKLLLLLPLLWMSCAKSTGEADNTEAPDGAVFTKNFIQTYVMPENIAARNSHNRYIEVEFKGVKLSNWNQDVTAEYNKVSEKYGDDSFNNKMVQNTIIALGEDCVAIDVECDKKIDAAHPAGGSLKDIVKLCAVSFHDYVYGNYIQPNPVKPAPEEFRNLSLYNGLGSNELFKPLSEVTPDQLVLVQPRVYLYMPTLPAGDYNFTITTTFGGEELTTTIATTIK